MSNVGSATSGKHWSCHVEVERARGVWKAPNLKWEMSGRRKTRLEEKRSGVLCNCEQPRGAGGQAMKFLATTW